MSLDLRRTCGGAVALAVSAALLAGCGTDERSDDPATTGPTTGWAVGDGWCDDLDLGATLGGAGLTQVTVRSSYPYDDAVCTATDGDTLVEVVATTGDDEALDAAWDAATGTDPATSWEPSLTVRSTTPEAADWGQRQVAQEVVGTSPAPDEDGLAVVRAFRLDAVADSDLVVAVRVLTESAPPAGGEDAAATALLTDMASWSGVVLDRVESLGP